MTVPTLARHATVSTPPGPFTVVVDTDADGRDVVVASGWTADIADLLPVVHASLRPAGSELVDRLPVLDVVEEFVAGRIDVIDGVFSRRMVTRPAISVLSAAHQDCPWSPPERWGATSWNCF